MSRQTLIFVLQNDKVLLGLKKRGFGVNKWNGFGGKIEDLESSEMCIIRELEEETGLEVTISDLNYLGFIQFFINDEMDRIVYIYTTHKVNKDPVETNEMKPDWFNLTEIPFQEMWSDAYFWIPYVISGKYFEGTFHVDENGDISVIHIEIKKS